MRASLLVHLPRPTAARERVWGRERGEGASGDELDDGEGGACGAGGGD